MHIFHAENGVVSLSLGATVAITIIMEGLILVTIFGSLIVLVYSCAKRNNGVKSKRNSEFLHNIYHYHDNVFLTSFSQQAEMFC